MLSWWGFIFIEFGRCSSVIYAIGTAPYLPTDHRVMKVELSIVLSGCGQRWSEPYIGKHRLHAALAHAHAQTPVSIAIIVLGGVPQKLRKISLMNAVLPKIMPSKCHSYATQAYRLIAGSELMIRVKEVWNSVKIWLIYGQHTNDTITRYSVNFKMDAVLPKYTP